MSLFKLVGVNTADNDPLCTHRGSWPRRPDAGRRMPATRRVLPDHRQGPWSFEAFPSTCHMDGHTRTPGRAWVSRSFLRSFTTHSENGHAGHGAPDRRNSRF